MFMNKDQNLINEFAIKTLKENLNVMYAQIWREGQLTAEYKRMPVKTRLNTWSACKGVVSCAAGIALDEGLIRLDEKIVDIFPEYAPENPEGYLGDVTLENMLTMTTGLESSLFFCDWPERYTTPDWIRYFFENAKVIKKPGTEWLYSNFNTYMISCAIEKRAGVNLLEYLRNRFFEPLGIGNPDWTLCPKGHVHAANGLYVNIDEFTRYGQMILHKGNYNGKQLVPESYMKMATSNLVDNSAAGSPLTLSDLPDRILIIPESLSSIDDFLFSGNPPPETLQLLLHPCQETPDRTDHNFHRIDRNRLPDS